MILPSDLLSCKKKFMKRYLVTKQTRGMYSQKSLLFIGTRLVSLHRTRWPLLIGKVGHSYLCATACTVADVSTVIYVLRHLWVKVFFFKRHTTHVLENKTKFISSKRKDASTILTSKIKRYVFPHFVFFLSSRHWPWYRCSSIA